MIDLEKQRAVLEKNSLAAAEAAVRARTKELRAANDAAQVERVRRGRDPENIDRKRKRIRERYETKPGTDLERIEDKLVRNVQADLLRREQELEARIRTLAPNDPEKQRLKKQAGKLDDLRNNRDRIEKQLGDQVVEQKLRNHIEQMQNNMKVFRDLTEEAATTLIDGLAKAVAESENLKEAFKKIGIELLKLAVQKLVIDQAKGLLSNALDSLFGIPGKAAGGPVGAGRLYMVGERGKELFRPRVAGEIVPNYKLRPALAGAGGNAFQLQHQHPVERRPGSARGVGRGGAGDRGPRVAGGQGRSAGRSGAAVGVAGGGSWLIPQASITRPIDARISSLTGIAGDVVAVSTSVQVMLSARWILRIRPRAAAPRIWTRFSSGLRPPKT